jgi:hypothetical protein
MCVNIPSTPPIANLTCSIIFLLYRHDMYDKLKDKSNEELMIFRCVLKNCITDGTRSVCVGVCACVVIIVPLILLVRLLFCSMDDQFFLWCSKQSLSIGLLTSTCFTSLAIMCLCVARQKLERHVEMQAEVEYKYFHIQPNTHTLQNLMCGLIIKTARF